MHEPSFQLWFAVRYVHVAMCVGLVDALVLESGSELFRWTERQREPLVVSVSNHERARPSTGSRRAE